MGVLPFEFMNGENGDSLGLKGDETFSILNIDECLIGTNQIVDVETKCGKVFKVKSRIDTDVEIE